MNYQFWKKSQALDTSEYLKKYLEETKIAFYAGSGITNKSLWAQKHSSLEVFESKRRKMICPPHSVFVCTLHM